jgi:hypothetical protein
MSLRVAFDMDGTVADMQSVLRREAERLFGAAVVRNQGDADPAPSLDPAPLPASGPTSPPTVETLILTSRQQRMLWDRIATIEDFWFSLPEQEPGIIARIFAAARRRRWEVLFITTRPPSAGPITQLQTQRWLEAHGFTLPSVFVVQRSRGKLADALQLDAVVDDRPENCLDVAIDSKATPLLVWNAPVDGVPAGLTTMGVKPVASISEALAVLERMDDTRRESPVVRSLKRMLGRGPLD